MGKKGKWFGAVKKVFSPESKEKDDQRTHKQKKKWGFGRSKHTDPCSSSSAEACSAPAPPAVPPPMTADEVKLTAEVENEQNKHAYSVALASAVAAEAAVAAAQAAAEVVRLTTTAGKFSGKSTEEIAAIKIQTAFRGYLARRALRALRGLVRLKSLVHGNAVKRQSATTLRCMQTLARVQSQIRSRRIRMAEENQALQRQLQLKRERELEALRASMGEDWDDSLQSKEQIEASVMNKHGAAIRRERALAYAFSHQWKSSSRSVNPMFTDPTNPQWGWSWLERWMAARPWEGQSVTDKELSNDHASVKSSSCSVGGGEITKAYARRDANPDRPSPVAQKSSRPPFRQSLSTPPSKAPSVAGKIRPASDWDPLSEEDSRSLLSLQLERNRRHSIAGSSVRDDDDESPASSPAVPNYMTPTKSAKAKSRFQSPSSDKVVETLEKGSSVGSVKKRLSFPAAGEKYSSPFPAGVRRHSGPPKVKAFGSSASETGKGKNKMCGKNIRHGFHLVKGKSSHAMEEYVVAQFKQKEDSELGLFAILLYVISVHYVL